MVEEKQTFNKLRNLKGNLQEETSSDKDLSGEVNERLNRLKERRRALFQNSNLEEDFKKIKVEIDKKIDKKDINLFIEWLTKQYE